MNAANTPPPLRFESSETLTPQYTNLIRLSHSPMEFVLDFARILPGETGAKLLQRMIMSPTGAKLLMRALAENISRYESSFGDIMIPTSGHLAEELFRPPTPPDNPPEEK